MYASPLSRTSSAASIWSVSDDGSSNAANPKMTRRTRKRFTNVQLTMLEDLFHKNSHPSRGDREAVAHLGGMEIKSVTIWFQNKRQTERRALHNATNTTAHNSPSATITSTSCSAHSITSPRPSLDRVASRSELRVPAPRTPTRRHNPHANIWENMPSSPIAPPVSPSSPEYVGFTKSKRAKRSLEWACAAARLADKKGAGVATRRNESEASDSTDDEAYEAITPPSTWGKGDTRWAMEHGTHMTVPHKGVQDEEMMKAALALCGLGRRTHSKCHVTTT